MTVSWRSDSALSARSGSNDNLTIKTNDTSVASITDAQPQGNPLQGGNTSVTPDGSTVQIEGAAAETADTGEVTIATVELETGRPGTARVAVNVASLSDENGSIYTGVGEEHVTLTVGQLQGPPAIVDDKRPTDTDNNGVFEDINGNGEFDTGDVTALWAHRNNDNVTSNPQAFDVNGDGTFGVNDVTALWNDYLTG